MPRHKDNRAAHRRIAAQLRAEIMSGDRAPGEVLPPTGALAEMFDTSNTTVQAVIATLVAEGYIETQKGAHRRVRPRPATVVDVGPYFAPTPGGVSYEILAVEEAWPPAEVQRVLGPHTAILRKRRLLRDGEPAEVNHAWYPASIAAGTELARKAKIRGGAPRALADLGYPQRRMIDQISVRLPTTEEYEALELTEEVPIIRQFRVIYSDDDRPVEVAVMVKAGNLFELRYPSIPLNTT